MGLLSIQEIKQGQKTVGFCSFVAILANYFLPVNWALVAKRN